MVSREYADFADDSWDRAPSIVRSSKSPLNIVDGSDLQLFLNVEFKGPPRHAFVVGSHGDEVREPH